MCITSGGKSHDATAVKLWYEVYFLGKTEDLTGGPWNSGDGERMHQAHVFLGVAPSASMMKQRIPRQGLFSGH